MDEKTAELRDIFLDVTDGEAVTERQAGGRGTLAGEGGAVTERLAAVIAKMRETFDFETDLDDPALVAVVTRFHQGESDAEMAAAVSAAASDEDAGGETVSAETVARARWDLHLLREAELDPPVPRAELVSAADAAEDLDALADDLGMTTAELRRYRAILDARREALRVNHRFRAEFETLLAESELSETLTAHESGLEGATEGQEIADDVDLSF